MRRDADRRMCTDLKIWTVSVSSHLDAKTSLAVLNDVAKKAPYDLADLGGRVQKMIPRNGILHVIHAELSARVDLQQPNVCSWKNLLRIRAELLMEEIPWPNVPDGLFHGELKDPVLFCR